MQATLCEFPPGRWEELYAANPEVAETLWEALNQAGQVLMEDKGDITQTLMLMDGPNKPYRVVMQWGWQADFNPSGSTLSERPTQAL